MALAGVCRIVQPWANAGGACWLLPSLVIVFLRPWCCDLWFGPMNPFSIESSVWFTCVDGE